MNTPKFSNEIFFMILDYYEFESFQDMKKILLISKLFYEYMKKNIIKVIVMLQNDNIDTVHGQSNIFTLKYEDKKLRLSRKIKISRMRYVNMITIFFKWNVMKISNMSQGDYYNYFYLEEFHYIMHRNLFYQSYFKFIYYINSKQRYRFTIRNIINEKKYIIDDERCRGSLCFEKLGEENINWISKNMQTYFDNLIFQKLLLFKYLKNRNANVLRDYINLFKDYS